MELLAGFLLGFLGSFHCIVMCGPIALSLPGSNRTKFNFILERLSYNLGRITLYSLLGLIFGFFGERIFIAEFQQLISVMIGVIILLYLIKPFLKKKKSGNIFNPVLSKSPFSFLKNIFANLYSRNSKLSLFSIGLLNGILPCGFVYIALSGPIALGSPVKGFLFMTLFGLGTLPLMLGISMSRNFISITVRRKINKLSPVITIIFALLFIVRGLNLGIPYLSPGIPAQKINQPEIICH